MMRIVAILFTLIMLSQNALACPVNSRQEKALYQVVNDLFAGEGTLNTDLELFATEGIQYIENDTLWGQASDEFSIEMTYAGSRDATALGVMDDDGYHALIDLAPYEKCAFVVHDNVAYSLAEEDENGFMWVHGVGNGNWGTNIFSDADYNYGQHDLFMAFRISDSQWLDHYYGVYADVYGGQDLERMEELWLIAFDGGDKRWGDFNDLVAVASWASESTMVATPIPGSVVLLAGGCVGLFGLRRRKVV